MVRPDSKIKPKGKFTKPYKQNVGRNNFQQRTNETKDNFRKPGDFHPKRAKMWSGSRNKQFSNDDGGSKRSGFGGGKFNKRSHFQNKFLSQKKDIDGVQNKSHSDNSRTKMNNNNKPFRKTKNKRMNREVKNQLKKEFRKLKKQNNPDTIMIKSPEELDILNTSNKSEIHKLNIIKCQLERIDTLNISDFTNLTYLNLSTNKLSSKSLNYIANLSQLILLNISFNKIDTISSLLYPVMNHLQGFIANDNKFYDCNFISQLKNCNTIVLSKNNISVLNNIGELNDLQKISISNNNFAQIPDFSSNHHLREIRLNNNSISNIPSNYLPSSIKVIELGNNKISEYDDIKSLFSLQSLENLNLFKNPISALSDYKTTIISHLPQLLVHDSIQTENGKTKQLQRRNKNKSNDDNEQTDGKSIHEETSDIAERNEEKKDTNDGQDIKNNNKKVNIKTPKIQTQNNKSEANSNVNKNTQPNQNVPLKRKRNQDKEPTQKFVDSQNPNKKSKMEVKPSKNVNMKKQDDKDGSYTLNNDASDDEPIDIVEATKQKKNEVNYSVIQKKKGKRKFEESELKESNEVSKWD